MKSRDWAIRCIHEASLYLDNCFITLTYNNEHLPPGGTLVLEHYQKFMKRLRKANGNGIRFFHCGEYGSTYGRPHYHSLLFNFDFPDKRIWKTERGVSLYTSKKLEELWPFGFSTIGAVTFESSAYVARYIMKKVTGDPAEEHYKGRKPEYITMSRKPGLGTDWLKKYGSDVFPDDFVVINGKKLKPPRFYEKILEIDQPSTHALIKRKRTLAAIPRKHDQTPDRLAVREKCQLSKLKRLKRIIE